MTTTMTDFEAKDDARRRRKEAGVGYDRCEHLPHLYREADVRATCMHLTDEEITAAKAKADEFGLADVYKWQIAQNTWEETHRTEIIAWAKSEGIWPSGKRKPDSTIVSLYLHGGTVQVPRRVEPGWKR